MTRQAQAEGLQLTDCMTEIKDRNQRQIQSALHPRQIAPDRSECRKKTEACYVCFKCLLNMQAWAITAAAAALQWDPPHPATE